MFIFMPLNFIHLEPVLIQCQGAFWYGVLNSFHLSHWQEFFELKSKEKQCNFISARKLKSLWAALSSASAGSRKTITGSNGGDKFDE